MSRGLGRVERVCLSVLGEAEKDRPAVGRTAHEIAVVAFAVEDPWARGGKHHGQSIHEAWDLRIALSSVRRALRRLKACGMVRENGLSESYAGNEGLVDTNGQLYKHKRRKLYRAVDQRPILLPDLSMVPLA